MMQNDIIGKRFFFAYAGMVAFHAGLSFIHNWYDYFIYIYRGRGKGILSRVMLNGEKRRRT
jgi:hypothetical protein